MITVDREEIWRLRDEQDFLTRSLSDAELEHSTGDLSDEDFEILKKRDLGRLAVTTARLEELDQLDQLESSSQEVSNAGPLESVRKRPRAKTLLIATAVIFLVAAAIVFVARVTKPRLPGQDSSGSITLSGAQRIQSELGQADALVTKGNVKPALEIYHKVLLQDPNEPEALAETGWIEWESGHVIGDSKLVNEGKSYVEKAVKTAPTFYAAHLFLGTILLVQDGEANAAVAQYKLFLAENPPIQDVQNAASYIREAYTKAGVALPALSQTQTSSTSGK